MENGKSGKFEFVCTVAIALAALLSAWCTLQSALWNGTQAFKIAEFDAAGRAAAKWTVLAHKQNMVDLTTFVEYVNAYETGNEKLAAFYSDRFRPEFKPAFEAWMAEDPFNNSKAQPHPFFMAEYQLALSKKADEETGKSNQALNEARRASAISDSYVLNTVLFALVLFFCGIGGQTKRQSTRVLMLTIGMGMGILATFLMIFYPKMFAIESLKFLVHK